MTKQYETMLYSTPVIIADVWKKVRVRRHKKRRIDKKWLKRYGYHYVQDNYKVFKFEDKLIMTEKCYERLKKVCDEKRIGELLGGADNG
jgi:hypothetical protein